jgi:Secretion system C-terminal sorting domain
MCKNRTYLLFAILSIFASGLMAQTVIQPKIYNIAADVCGSDKLNQFFLIRNGSSKLKFQRSPLDNKICTFTTTCATGNQIGVIDTFFNNTEAISKLNERVGTCSSGQPFKSLMNSFEGGFANVGIRILVFPSRYPKIEDFPANSLAMLCGQEPIYVVFGNYKKPNSEQPMFPTFSLFQPTCGVFTKVEANMATQVGTSTVFVKQKFDYKPKSLADQNGAFVRISPGDIVSYGVSPMCTSTAGLTCNIPFDTRFSGETKICQGNRTTITAADRTDRRGNYTYKWSNGTVGASINVGPEISTDYYVTVTNPDQPLCWNVAKIRVEVITFPEVNVRAISLVNGHDAICYGDVISLDWGLQSTTLNPYSFNWVNQQNQPISPRFNCDETTSGTYSLVINYGSGCSLVKPLDVNYKTPTPYVICTNAPICNNEELELTVTPANDNALYTWRRESDGYAQIGPASQLISNPISDTYNLTVVDEDGCENSESTYILINDCGGGGNVTTPPVSVQVKNNNVVDRSASLRTSTPNRKDVVLYPNPATNIFNLVIPQDMGLCRIEVFDALSRKVKTLEGAQQVEVNTDSWSGGMYFVKVTSLVHDGGSTGLNVVIERR